MPNNVKTYDRSDDLKDHLKIFQAAVKVERWVWFDDLPPKSIDSYDDLKKAFIANFLQQKKFIKDPVEIHHIKQREGESTEDFVQRFKAESRHVEGAPECMRISGFMHGITNPELIKRLHDNIPRPVNEMMRPKASKKGETSGKDKHLEILMVQPWQRVAKKKITQSFSPNPKISFPPLGDEDGTEGPMSIEAEIGGHFIYIIYRTPHWLQWRDHMANETNIAAGGILTMQRSKIIPLECTRLSGLESQPFDTIQTAEERIKVTIHPEYPEQKITIGSTVTEEGRKIFWRMCVDFKDLNKACPKDGYPLPKIDWKVESLCGYPFKCFLDAYKGYHQIKIAKEDEEKIAFITSQRIFCYSKMPFGLKNARVTYQRLVDKAFQKKISKNLEVYVDDLVIKSRTEHKIMRDGEETFKTLREINMKLNPKKCTFGIEEGMFLGYKVNTKEIKVCPDMVEAVLSLPSPKCLKDVQKLNGKLASLNIFLSKSAEKSLSFFKTLKKCTKKSDFQWTAKAKVTFKQMMKLKAKLPTLTAPMEKEELIVYLVAAREAYRLRTSVKGQILADFIVERPEEDSLVTTMEVEEEPPKLWTLFMDRSSCMDGSEAGLILTSSEGTKFTYALRFRFDATNNEAEYEVLIAGLRIVEQMGVQKEVLTVVEEEGSTWITPIYEYLMKETLSVEKEKEKERSLRRKSGRYAVINKILYKKSYLGPWLRCDGPLQANYVLREIHEGSCIMHAGTRSVAHCTMIKSSNEDTPFSLTYGTEAVILAEIDMPTLRTAEIDMVQNDEALEIHLDLLEERSFKLGDLVYVNNDVSHAKDSGKHNPKWEGLYKVTEALGSKAYKLRDHNRKLLPRTWNVRNL
ncbi:reverse transcriptase domain-containing protein [Tanacetum coccineum]|uniref:Reverse transcriptase domain-containing protein n=1 Tax=Tanacetum coccineum TaxID=301880 RepID=A0ABQ4XDL5_9ASTR